MQINLKTIRKVYINMKKETQRNYEFLEFIKKLGYVNFERFDAVVLPKQRNCFNVGCSKSHNLAMNQNRSKVPFMLMEDDCRPTKWYSEYVSNDGFIEIPDNADAIYLGYSTAGHHTWFRANSINDKWVKLNSCMATHCILFLNDNIEKFISNSASTISRKEALDVGYARDVLKHLNVYAPKKVLFYQNNGCVITTHVNIDPDKNQWSSYHHDGKLNFDRKIIYDNNV